MKKLLLLFYLFTLQTTLMAQDTFSIVAVDPETGEVGSAGASCVDGAASIGGVIIINQIIPGKGGVNAQALICINPHSNLNNAIEQMAAGLSPNEIVTWLQQTDECAAGGNDPQQRQYGIVDFDVNDQPRTAAFTGTSTLSYAGHILGPNYAIQGNILLGAQVLQNMEAAFNGASGSLAVKLMAALQGANIAGADSRCLARGTSSTSSYLRVYKPEDSPSLPYLEFNIAEVPFGVEPIDSLQTLFDEWYATVNTMEVDAIDSNISVSPNPAKDIIEIESKGNFMIESYRIVDTSGQLLIYKNQIQAKKIDLDISDLLVGIYLLYVINNKNQKFVRKFVKAQ